MKYGCTLPGRRQEGQEKTAKSSYYVFIFLFQANGQHDYKNRSYQVCFTTKLLPDFEEQHKISYVIF